MSSALDKMNEKVPKNCFSDTRNEKMWTNRV